MGIQGLLKALEDVQRECHVKAVRAQGSLGILWNSSKSSDRSLLEKKQPLMLMVGCMLPWQEVILSAKICVCTSL